MRAALEVLTDTSEREASSRRHLGHIVVISPNTGLLLKDVPYKDSIPVHVICPGMLPWKGFETTPNRGWTLHPAASLTLEELSQSDTLEKCLKTFMKRLSSGIEHGHLADLRINIEPGPGCYIEAILGDNGAKVLKPGQIHCIFVHLRATSWMGARSQAAKTNANDLMSQIDMMLGEASQLVLTAEVRYQHSQLPQNTLLTVKQACRLRKALSESAWSRGLTLANRKLQLHKRLAYFISTQHTPHQAIIALQDKFGPGGNSAACPAYIKQLMDELQYRSRIGRCSDDLTEDGFYTPTAQSFDDVFLDSQNMNETEKSYRSVTAPERELVEMPEGDDEARKIWGNMKRAASGSRPAAEAQREHETADAIEAQYVMAMALRNKRSIGADTIRSIAFAAHGRGYTGGYGMGRGFSGPWV